MLRWMPALLALTISVPAMAQTTPGLDDNPPITGTPISAEYRSRIQHGMLDSAVGWNSGDIDRFLAIYSDDPATSFTTDKGMARGKAAVRARYLKSYPQQFGPARGAGASRLSFTFEDFRYLGGDHALLIARWKLVDGSGKELSGMTSLVFRNEKGGWKIVADHSS